MNDNIEEIKKQVDIAKKNFDEHPSILTGRRYGDLLEQLRGLWIKETKIGIISSTQDDA